MILTHCLIWEGSGLLTNCITDFGGVTIVVNPLDWKDADRYWIFTSALVSAENKFPHVSTTGNPNLTV